MERVTLLVDRTGGLISCLLNPERLEVRRTAGLRRRTGAGGVLMGGVRADDPLIATGGGVTEYDLYLLFDVEVAREGRAWAAAGGRAQQAAEMAAPSDVRELTRPLWNLAENGRDTDGPGPDGIRFIWGKNCIVPAVVVAVAERLEQFDVHGAPQRSWLSLRLRRVDGDRPERDLEPGRGPATTAPDFDLVEEPPAPSSEGAVDRIDVPSDELGAPLERLDLIAADRYGDPGLAAALAAYNDLDDMLRAPPDASLALPPARVLREYAR